MRKTKTSKIYLDKLKEHLWFQKVLDFGLGRRSNQQVELCFHPRDLLRKVLVERFETLVAKSLLFVSLGQANVFKI